MNSSAPSPIPSFPTPAISNPSPNISNHSPAISNLSPTISPSSPAISNPSPTISPPSPIISTPTLSSPSIASHVIHFENQELAIVSLQNLPNKLLTVEGLGIYLSNLGTNKTTNSI